MPPGTVRLEDARPADQDAIRRLTLAAYAEYAAQIPHHWAGYRANIVETLADPAPAEQIVARFGDELVGSVLLYPADPEPDGHPWPVVRLLAVHPGRRRQGIGLALMQECIRRARQAGAGTLSLNTSGLMRAAVRLYERLGFVRTPDQDSSPAPGLTIKGYRLELGEQAPQRGQARRRANPDV